MTWSRKKTDEKGYTLIEVIVVLVIIAIVAGTAIGGLMMYRRYAAFKKNNEYAQTIFSAAQASLSHAKVSGQLEELREELENGSYDKNQLKEGMIVHGAELEKRAGEGGLYFLCYKKGESVTSGAEKILYDMLEGAAYDETILNATFCVEFDAVDGTVLGVCYSDRAEDFSYSGGNTDKETGTVNIKDRDQAARKKTLLGYYGVKKLSARAPQKTEEKFIKEVLLVNDDTLYAQWEVDGAETGLKPAAMQYEMQVMRKNQVIASFEIDASGLKDKNTHGQSVACDVYFYDAEGKKEETPLKYHFPAYIDGQKVVLALDAADLAAAQLLTLEAAGENFGGTDAQLYKDTYSIRRFTDRPENLHVQVQAYVKGVQEASSTAWKTSNDANAYFGDKVTTDEAAHTQTFEVANARHLYNVRFTEKNREQEGEQAISCHYEQTADINWGGKNGFVGQGNVYTAMQPESYDADMKVLFPAISVLTDGDSYSGQGKQQKLEELYMAAESGPLGLFGINRGTVQNLTMRNCVIAGEKTAFVGSFCGVNAGTLSSLSTTGDKAEVKGGNYVGGITGSDGFAYVGTDGIKENANTRSYKMLSNEARVISAGTQDSQNFAGGIAGYLNGEDHEVKVKGFENSGDITSNYANANGEAYVGGIFGYAEHVEIEESVTENCKITGSAPEEYRGGIAGYIGGIAGYVSEGDVEECEVRSCAVSEKRSNNEKVIACVGGIAGGLTDGEVSECTFAEGTVKAVYGNVGGIVGKNDVDGGVTECSTEKTEGKEAGVEIEKYATNTGCGGIIGLNTSTEKISGNVNNIRVAGTGRASDNVSGVGGIVGRQESAAAFTIEQCTNTGEVSDYIIPGGIVGRVKTAGGTVKNCVNKGQVFAGKEQANPNEGAGGIVGNIYELSDAGQTVTVSGCENHGKISSVTGNNGGILGSVSGGNGGSIQIQDCRNTGRITSAVNSISNAGIVAYANNGKKTVITNCKNYGTGEAGQQICGILATASSSVTLSGNMGISSCGVPVAPSGTAATVAKDNYYFSELKVNKVKTASGLPIEAVEIYDKDGNLMKNVTDAGNIIDGSLQTRCAYKIPDKAESTIVIRFKPPEAVRGDELKSLDLYWYGDNREYTYTLLYADKNKAELNTFMPLFEENGKAKEFKGTGYDENGQIVNSVDLTQGNQEQNKKIWSIAIHVTGHNQPNEYVSLYEAVVNENSSETEYEYEAETITGTKGTALGVIENAGSYYAMNKAENKRIEGGMTFNPLSLTPGCAQSTCEDGYKALDAKKVTEGTLTELELGDLSGVSADKLLGWKNAMWYVSEPAQADGGEAEAVEEQPEEETPETTDRTGEGQTAQETPEAETAQIPEVPEEEPIPEPEKKEFPVFTETVLADSKIPQSAISWEEEAYVGTYDIALKADENETLHYKMMKSGDAGNPYRILKETDKTDKEGNVIWEEAALRKDEEFPKTETLVDGTQVTTYYYPLGYKRTVEGKKTEEQRNEAGEAETVELPCQTEVEGYFECVAYTKPDGTVTRTLYLVLPDIETAQGIQCVYGTQDAYRFTSDILITNEVADGETCEAPAPAHWWRESDAAGNQITKIREAGKENED